MGSYEIDRSSDESIQDIVAVETPSPLTSSHSSDSNKSLLISINELTFGGLSLRSKDLEKESSSDEEAENLQKKQSLIKNKILSDPESISLESSASSLKRRLQNLPSPIEDAKLAERVAALDRRIRREKEIYLQLQSLSDRIEEKDEVEVSSLTDSASKTNLHPEVSSTIKDARSRRREKMCSSAPDTMRLDKEAFKQPLHDFATTMKKPLAKKYDERRPPKYLQPLEAPVKEILRCNAPPLCITDKKIAELLRRGSISAREDYLRKTTKITNCKKPTGMIIKNLSSGSKEDSASNWLIREGSGVAKFENKLIESKSLSVGSRIKEKSCEELKNNIIDENNDLPSSRSSKMMKASLKNSMDQLKIVLKEFDSNGNDSHLPNLPKLDIQSREYSQSNSQASREDSAKRSLDMKALFRALSDVSIKQQKDGDQKVCKTVENELQEPRRNYSKIVHRPRCSSLDTEEFVDSKEDDKIACKKIIAEESDMPDLHNTPKRTVAQSSPTKKNLNSRSTNFIDSNRCSLKLKSPEVKSRNSKSPRMNFQSFDSLLQNRENQENVQKVSNDSAKIVLSEPGTSRNGRMIPQNHSESMEDKFKYLQRGSKIPYVRSSSESGSSDENDFKPKILRPSATGFHSADQLKSEARFKIYEDTEEASPRPELTFLDEEMNTESKTICTNGLPVRKESQLEVSSTESFNDCKSLQKNDEEKSKDLNRTRSCSNSRETSSEKMKHSATSSERSSKLFSNRTPMTSGSSSSPRFANRDAEKLFTASSIAKRLSYSELQTSNLNDDNSDEELSSGRKIFLQDQPEISSPEEIPLNSSRKNLATTVKSTETVHQFIRSLERATIRPKISSSLSKLSRSPEPDISYRRKSQDRFPFTISESTSAKSSSKLKGEQAIKELIIEPSETAYRLRVHPSLLRLAGAGIEATAGEIIVSASRDPEIRTKKNSFVKKFVGRFSSKWGKSRKLENKPGSGTTKVLYENKKCRSDGSSGSASAEKPSRRFNRDGLWVEGLRDENLPHSDEDKDYFQQLRDIEEQATIDRYSMFLAKRENQRRQFSKYGFSPKNTPSNRLMNDENSDDDPGCFCNKISQFLIGAKVNSSRHRSSLFLRVRHRHRRF